MKATPPPPTQARAWMTTGPDSHAVPIEPRRPSIDKETEAVLGEAVASLGTLRGLEWIGDNGVVVHLLASLIAQAQNLLGQAVVSALDQEYTWSDLAHLLGTTEADARRRFLPRI